jgi:hypothetical protein
MRFLFVDYDLRLILSLIVKIFTQFLSTNSIRVTCEKISANLCLIQQLFNQSNLSQMIISVFDCSINIP